MTNHDTEPPLAHDTAQSIEFPTSRARLVGALVLKGAMHAEFAQSDALDHFMIDEETGADSLVHVLIGDEYGGAHHLRTILDAEVPGRVIASEIPDYSAPNHASLSKLKKAQRVRENGTYRARIVGIGSGDGESPVKHKIGGSAMFPDEWNSQEVIEAIKEVASAPPLHYDQERSSYTHTGKVDDVSIKVITDKKTGKIITAMPK